VLCLPIPSHRHPPPPPGRETSSRGQRRGSRRHRERSDAAAAVLSPITRPQPHPACSSCKACSSRVRPRALQLKQRAASPAPGQLLLFSGGWSNLACWSSCCIGAAAPRGSSSKIFTLPGLPFALLAGHARVSSPIPSFVKHRASFRSFRPQKPLWLLRRKMSMSQYVQFTVPSSAKTQLVVAAG
jgi:hypothetical protein